MAGDNAGVVGPLQFVPWLRASQGPLAVEHFQRAADVAKRIGKMVVVHRAAIQADQQVLMHFGPFRLVAPIAKKEIERPLRVERAQHRPVGVVEGGQQLFVQRNLVSSGFDPAGEIRTRMADVGIQHDRPSTGIGRQVGGQPLIVELQAAGGSLQPIGKLIASKRHVQTTDRDVRRPFHSVVDQTQQIDVDLPFGRILGPLFAHRLGQDAPQVVVERDPLAHHLQIHRLGTRVAAPAAADFERGGPVAGIEIGQLESVVVQFDVRRASRRARRATVRRRSAHARRRPEPRTREPAPGPADC